MTPGLEGLDLIMTDYWFKCAKEAIAASLVSLGRRAFVYRFAHNLSIAASLWESEFGLPQCVKKVRAGAGASALLRGLLSLADAAACVLRRGTGPRCCACCADMPHGGAAVRLRQQRDAWGDGLVIHPGGDLLLGAPPDPRACFIISYIKRTARSACDRRDWGRRARLTVVRVCHPVPTECDDQGVDQLRAHGEPQYSASREGRCVCTKMQCPSMISSVFGFLWRR